MEQIYYKKYVYLIEEGEITPEQAIETVPSYVPKQWQEKVIDLLLQYMESNT